jgi:transposase
MAKRSPPLSPQARERAVQMVPDHQGERGAPCAALRPIAARIGGSGEPLRNRLRRAERNQGSRAEDG